MNEGKNLPLRMGFLYGAFLGVVVVSIGIIRYRTGMILRGDQTLSYVYWGIFTTTVFIAVFHFKKLDPLSFYFKRTVKIGLITGLISGSMYTLYIVILNNYVDPNLSSKIIQYNSLYNPELSKDELSNSAQIMKMNAALRGLIYTMVCMFFGTLHSIISTSIAKLSLLSVSRRDS